MLGSKEGCAESSVGRVHRVEESSKKGVPSGIILGKGCVEWKNLRMNSAVLTRCLGEQYLVKMLG
jgi:hypothetical protein